MAHFMAQKKNESIRTKDDLRVVVKPGVLPDRMLPAMPIRIQHEPLPVEVSYRRTEGDVIFRIQLDGSRRNDFGRLSAYDSRDTFLRIRKPGEALDFFGVTGYFRFDEFLKRNLCETLAWSEFQRWQELITIRMRNGFNESKSTLTRPRMLTIDDVPKHLRALKLSMNEMESRFFYRIPKDLAINSEPEVSNPWSRPVLFAEMHVRTTLQAILATTYVDSLSGVNYGLCALPSCNRAFEVTSKHEREYCSQACAHKASVKKRRAKEKEERDRVKASAARIKAKKERG